MSGATGNITLSLPQSIATTSSSTRSITLSSALTLGNGGYRVRPLQLVLVLTLALQQVVQTVTSTSLTGLSVINPTAGLTIGGTGPELAYYKAVLPPPLRQLVAFTSTLAFAAPTANQTITIPNASGTICLSSGNCPSTGVGGSGTVNTIPLFNGATSLTR